MQATTHEWTRQVHAHKHEPRMIVTTSGAWKLEAYRSSAKKAIKRQAVIPLSIYIFWMHDSGTKKNS